MSSVSDQLADKKKRLQEIRARVNQMRGGGAAGGDGSPGRAASTSLSPGGVSDFASAGAGASIAGSPGAAPADGTTSRAASLEPTSAAAAAASSAGSMSPQAVPSGGTAGGASSVLAKLGGSSAKEAARVFPKPPTLTLVRPSALTWSVAPSGKADTYTKEVQTAHTGALDEAGSPHSPAAASVPRTGRQALAPTGLSKESVAKAKERIAEAEHDEVEMLTRDQQDQIWRSKPFSEFFMSQSFVVERALSGPDVLPPGVADSHEAVLVRGQGEPLVRTQLFNDALLPKKVTKGCPVTSVDFGSQAYGNAEMFLASYYKRGEGQTTLVDVEGQVLVWSVRVPQRPFQTLTAPSDVSKAMYCKFKPNLIVGGLYNGQICLWDPRTGSDPVQVSPLTMDAHTQPIFGMDVVGSVNSHSLVSLSSDGKVCAWQLEKLNAPVETHTLQHEINVGGASVAKEVQATSLGFRDGEANKFCFGSENGWLFSGTRSSGGSNPDGFQAHASPITALHCHPASPSGADDYSDLVLTASMDWTCKLWQPSKSHKPLFSFNEFTDYVYDVKWSPVHPAVFASVDGAGNLAVWNLIESMETPIGTVDAATSGKALCNLAWSDDGKSIIVGDAAGDITLWDVGGSESSPKAADWPLLGQKVGIIFFLLFVFGALSCLRNTHQHSLLRCTTCKEAKVHTTHETGCSTNTESTQKPKRRRKYKYS